MGVVIKRDGRWGGGGGFEVIISSSFFSFFSHTQSIYIYMSQFVYNIFFCAGLEGRRCVGLVN